MVQSSVVGQTVSAAAAGLGLELELGLWDGFGVELAGGLVRALGLGTVAGDVGGRAGARDEAGTAVGPKVLGRGAEVLGSDRAVL
ncbi:MAG TPA: hypothetical protein VGH44_00990 [Candidatus Saccharimonadia bacterium]